MSESSFVKGITRVPIEVQTALGLKNGHKIKWVLTEGQIVLISARPLTAQEIEELKNLKQKR